MKWVLLSLILSFNVFAQTRDEMLQDFMQQRRAMMQSMMEMFNESFEKDFFDMDDPFGDAPRFSGVGNNISIEEKYEEDGSISILIKPQTKNVNLDINTTGNRITIKSEIKQETKSEEEGSSLNSFSMSSSTKSIGIPEGYQAKSPEAVEGGIKISLVPSSKMKKIFLDKKPAKKPFLEQDPEMI